MADQDTTTPREQDVETEISEEQGTEGKQEQEQEERPLSDREILMNDLAARRKKQREAEEDQGDDSVPDEPAKPEAEEPKPAEKPSDEMVMLKVNGREVFKPKAEVEAKGGVEAYQKQLAADEKFRTLSQKEQELKRKEQELWEREQQMSQKPTQSEPTAQPSEDDGDIDWDAEAEAIVLGDSKKVADALRRIASRQKAQGQPVQQPNQVDPVKLREEIKRDLQADNDRRAALSRFADEFKDVNENPVMRTYANQRTIAIMNEDPSLGPWEVLKLAGEQTRTAMGEQKPANPLAERQQNKAKTAHRIPQANARSTPPSANEPQPKTKRQIFEDMQASRSH